MASVSKTTKSSAKKTSNAEAAAGANPTTAPGDLPPTRGTRSAPKGWKPIPTKGKGRRGPKPKGIQVATSLAVANEIAQSPTYVEDFKGLAPDPKVLSFLLTNGAKWRQEWEAAKSYLSYAASQRAAWEGASMEQMDALKRSYDVVAPQDPSVTKKYSATSKFLGATNQIAAHAAATRQAKTVAKAKATPAPAAASSTPGSSSSK